MKNCAVLPTLTILISLCCAAELISAPAKTSRSTTKPGAESKQAELPMSVFTIPSNAKEGRDPFFPNRLITGLPPGPKTNKPVLVPLKLALNGLSGTREKPLAIINNRTFEKGEEAELSTPSGRTRVRCIDIKEDSVTVEVNGQRQELRFRPGAQ
jgi:hypothetical protein